MVNIKGSQSSGGTSFGSSTPQQVCFEDRYFKGKWKLDFLASENLVHSFGMVLEGHLHQNCYCLTEEDADKKPQPPAYFEAGGSNEVTDITWPTGTIPGKRSGPPLEAEGEMLVRPSGYPKRKGDCIRIPSNPYVGSPELRTCQCDKKEPYKQVCVVEIPYSPDFGGHRQAGSEETVRKETFTQGKTCLNEGTAEAATFGDPPFGGVEDAGGMQDSSNNFLGCDCTLLSEPETLLADGDYVVLDFSIGSGYSDVTDSHNDPEPGDRKGDKINTKKGDSNYRRWLEGYYSDGNGVQPKDVFGSSWGTADFDYGDGPTIYIIEHSSPKRRIFVKIKGTGQHAGGDD